MNIPTTWQKYKSEPNAAACDAFIRSRVYVASIYEALGRDKPSFYSKKAHLGSSVDWGKVGGKSKVCPKCIVAPMSLCRGSPCSGRIIPTFRTSKEEAVSRGLSVAFFCLFVCLV